ncbi:MAG: DUF362 domain-containing protein [candidate division WOR-3 bacterium]
MAKVLILEADYENLRRSVAEVFNFFKPDLAHKEVFVKPNMLSARKPEEHVTTHPSLIRAVGQELIGRGANFVVGDNHSGEIGITNEEVARRTGILSAALGRFRNISRSGGKVKGFSRLIDELIVSTEILDCGYLISLPKFKTHALTMITGALKNMFGIIPGGLKSRIHYLCARASDFAQIIVDIYKIRPPDLTIMDAIVGMEGLGPGNGKIRPIGKLIASTNGAAVDIIMARMMGIDPQKILHLKYATEQGLVDPGQIEVIGNFDVLKKFQLPPTFSGRGIFKYLYDKVIHGIHLGRLPYVDINRCQRCKSCANICPAGAIDDQAISAPRVIPGKCILCYCCIEICPHNAIRTRLHLRRYRE